MTRLTPLEVVVAVVMWGASGFIYASLGSFVMWAGPAGLFVRQGRKSLQQGASSA